MQREPRRSHDELLQVYLRSLSYIPKLEPEELSHLQRELTRLRTRDPKAWREVRDRLVLHHQRLVIGYAMRFRHGSVPLLDLIQEGNLGLMRAAKNFDVDRGALFSTYATWSIRRHIHQALQSQSRTVHVSTYSWALERRVQKLEQQRSAQRGERPTTEEIAEELDLSSAFVDCLRGLASGSLSREGFCETLVDPAAAPPDAPVAENWRRRAFAQGLSSIDERARRVLTLRWGLGGAAPLTLEQTGIRLGISGERVRQIEKSARARLRRCPTLRRLLDLL